ncbi:uncharacterized protein LOC129728340 [Wyeomyia smithii]|uniref:uncharacterized protein LOC129728340 n=1 Tax=Wyeomyia smithii TaxID=174621 RepID=UPI0024680D1E|nr:uncharacterized protein LOC129728340 [Wyeomyia smithii]
MHVNINKCEVITFSHYHDSINHLYNITTTSQNRVQYGDLGVFMDSKICFNQYISAIITKAFSILGFINRNASLFTDVYDFKTVYTLVRSVLQYPAPNWTPYHIPKVIRIQYERIQNAFYILLFVVYRGMIL